MASTLAQAPAGNSSAPSATPSPIQRAIDLAHERRCEEALPLLNEYIPRITDKQLKYQALIATAHCAMRQRDGRATVNALLALRHEYPKDPEVLYLTTKVFLEIAVDASEQLASVAPDSYQVLELKAEALEQKKDWEGAAAVYRKILTANPKLPDIHRRLGRAELLQPESPANTENARKEFEEQLAIDPTDASAEYWLGALARRDGQWPEAIRHFTAAMNLDPNLTEAMLALGMTLNSAERFPDAITPLERYTKLVPDDRTGHYQLAIAYLRVGRDGDAAREKALVQQLSKDASGGATSDDSAAPH